MDGGLNTYGYVGGNSLHLGDPTGENAALLFPSVAGAAATGAGAGLFCPDSCGEIIPEVWDAAKNNASRNLGLALQVTLMAAHGNHADTAIQDAYSRECKKSDDRCEWLKRNAYKFPPAAVKATEKAWGCRPSRISKDKKKR